MAPRARRCGCPGLSYSNLVDESSLVILSGASVSSRHSTSALEIDRSLSCGQEAMDSDGKASWDSEGGSDTAQVGHDLKEHVHILPDEENGKSGSARSGESRLSYHDWIESSLGIESQPQWEEVDNLCRTIRQILNNPEYKDGDRLSSKDELEVRDVLQYHHNFEGKKGPGIDYIKIQQIYDSKTRCFWVVRMDGTEIDFSYHKCIKQKVARECPGLLEHYDFLYRRYPWRRGGAAGRGRGRRGASTGRGHRGACTETVY